MIASSPESKIAEHARRRVSARDERVIYIKRAKIAAFFAILFAYLFLLYFGTSIILPSAENDANTIARLAVSVDEVDSFDGYAAMAYIYGLTNDMIRYGIIIIISTLFFYNVIKWCKGIFTISIASFLCIAPVLLFLCFFIKDTFYLPFMMAALWALTRIRSHMIALLLAIALVVIYAFLFRQYFLIVATIFACLYIFKRLNWAARIAIILAIPFVLLAIPKDVYSTLQEQRDIVNQFRVGFTGGGNRTVFLNYMRPDGLYSFLVNYGYAFLRLNFPVFFGAGAKEAFLMVNVFAYGFLLWVALRSSDMRVWRPALLFLAHFLTLMLFEPDLGSYLRHIGTSLPLLAPAFGVLVKGDSPLFGNRPASKQPRRRSSRSQHRPVTHGTMRPENSGL